MLREPKAITTMNSVLGVKYDGGILVASDMAINYGTCYKFSDISHFVQLTPSLIIGASGEYADFQIIVDIVQSLIREHECETGGDYLAPEQIFSYVKRVLYQQRSRMRPLGLKILIAGFQRNGSSFLGAVDLYGTAWTDDFIGTQAAAHMQSPALAQAANQDRETVKKAMEDVFQTITSRFNVANGKIEFFDITKDGINRFEQKIEPNWEILEE